MNNAIKIQKKRKTSNLKIRSINGVEINKTKKGWIVNNGTKPVEKRGYHGRTIDYDTLSCWDAKNEKYIHVEQFQPVTYDLDNPMPKYNSLWEVYDGTGKNKKLLRIEFPPAYIKWYKTQLSRCVQGYDVGGVHITGPFYFFLNFWKIKGKGVGAGYITPRFLDIGKMFFDAIKEAQDQDKNVMFLKRRQIGCSEMCAAIAAWYYTFFPVSESIIIAGEGTYAENTVKKARAGLNELSRDSGAKSGDGFYKRRLKDTVEETISGWIENGITKGFQSRLLCVTVKDNIQRASGKSPDLVIMEEAGRFQHLKAVYNMVLPSVQEGGVQGGRIIIFIGTGGEMDKGVAEMQELFYKPETNNLLAVPNTWDKGVDAKSSKSSVFFPAWLYYVTDQDGNSYKELGTILIMEERVRLKEDLESLHVFKTQFPLTPAEAFTASGLSPFNVVKLSEQRTKILGNDWDGIGQRGRLDWIADAKQGIVGVRWTAADDISALDGDGDFLYPYVIYEHPEKPLQPRALGENLQAGETYLGDEQFINLYHAGTDPYDKEEAASSNSLGSCSIFKGMDENNLSGRTAMLFAARLTWRPSKPDKFYEATAKLCAYYNAQNLIEYSNMGIFNWYEKNGWEFLLKERPLLAQSVFKNSKVDNKYGLDPQAKPYLINAYKQYIEDYADIMYDLEQVQRAISFRRKGPNGKKHNDDITDAAMLAYQHYIDNRQRKFKVIEVNAKKKKLAKPLMGVMRTIDGRYRKVSKAA